MSVLGNIFRSRNVDDANCTNCGVWQDDVLHTSFYCERWRQHENLIDIEIGA